MWQGKLWVFATGGPTGYMESALVKPAFSPALADDARMLDRDGNELMYSVNPYCRDVPYDYSILGENITDPSHVSAPHSTTRVIAASFLLMPVHLPLPTTFHIICQLEAASLLTWVAYADPLQPPWLCW